MAVKSDHSCSRETERREKRRGKIQSYFIEQVTERIGKRYGISRERVASRFIEEGFLEWMADESAKIIDRADREKFPSVQAKCNGPVRDAVQTLAFCIDYMAIRPPDPIPPMLSPKQQEQRLEYQRKKLDAFNQLTPEEQAAVLAKREHRNRPDGLLKRIVTQYAAEEGREREEVFAELRGKGVTDLILAGLKTRREMIGYQIGDSLGGPMVRDGVRAIRVFLRCHTAEAIDAWRDATVAGRG